MASILYHLPGQSRAASVAGYSPTLGLGRSDKEFDLRRRGAWRGFIKALSELALVALQC